MLRLIAFVLLVSVAHGLFQQRGPPPDNLAVDAKVVPGLDFLGWGYDATYKDTFFALRPQLFLYTFDNKYQYTYPTDPAKTIYTVADQVFIRTATQTNTDTYLYTSMDQMTESLALHVGISGELSTASLSLSGSLTLDYLKKHTETYNTRLVMNKVGTALYVMQLSETNLCDSLKRDIAAMAPYTFAANKAKYTKFIARYGTHYVDAVVVGGNIDVTTEIKSTDKASDEEIAVALNGKLAMKNITVQIEAKIELTDAEKYVTEQTHSFSEIIGGNAEWTDFIMKAGQGDSAAGVFNSWKASLASNPVTMRYRLAEVWQLFDDVNQQMEMCKAMATYMGLDARSSSGTYCTTVVKLTSGNIFAGLEQQAVSQ